MGKSLEQYIEDNARFLVLEDGVPVQATYLGCEINTSNFDSSKEIAMFKLQVNGKERQWASSAQAAARAFAKLQIGDMVQIIRRGKGINTRYSIEKIC
ncbi:MAG: hypothetical protein PHH14_00570 [Candidatus Margulisbacteria bacterium]|nr:hypothetical protein [Candidatus Margulisiibacteriota bacterium]